MAPLVTLLALLVSFGVLVRCPAGRQLLAAADNGARWHLVSLHAQNGHDASAWRRTLQLAARASLRLLVGVPIALATRGDPLSHLEAYAQAAAADELFPFRDGLALTSHAAVSQIIGGPEQARRPAVFAHPLLVADPVPAECLRVDTLIFLPSGPQHTAVRRAVHAAVGAGLQWAGASPELLLPDGQHGAAAARQFLGVTPGAALNGTAVRALVLTNLFARMMGAPPDAPTLGAMLDYYDHLPLCLLGVDKERTRQAREATARGVLASPAGAKAAALCAREGCRTGALCQQLADGLLFAGGYGTTHLALHTLERIRAQPRPMVKLWAKDRHAFLLESARIDPPVLALTAITPRGGHVLTTAARGPLRLAGGVPLQLLLSHANRDPAVFARPLEFDPTRPRLSDVLSWNGKVHAVRAGSAPRGCPGHALSLDLAMQLVHAALPAEDEPPAPAVASAAQLDAEAAAADDARRATGAAGVAAGARARAQAEEAGAPDAHEGGARLAYVAWGVACVLGGTVLPALLQLSGGPASSCVAIFANAQQAVVLGWLGSRQHLRVADVLLPASSTIVRTQPLLGLLECAGCCGSAAAWLRLWLTLKHAALDSPPHVALAESAAALRLCARVLLLLLAVYGLVGAQAGASGYAAVCACVLLPAQLLALGATLRFCGAHGGGGAGGAGGARVVRWPLLLVVTAQAAVAIGCAACRAAGHGALADRLLPALAGALASRLPVRWRLGVERSLLVSLPCSLLAAAFCAAAAIDRRLPARDYAYPTRACLRRIVRWKQGLPLLLLLVVAGLHTLLLPALTADIARCAAGGGRVQERGGGGQLTNATAPAGSALAAGCAFDPTGAVEAHSRLFLWLVRMLYTEAAPSATQVRVPVETGAGERLPSLVVLPGLLSVPAFDEDEGGEAGTALSLGSQLLDGYALSASFFPLTDAPVGWTRPRLGDGALAGLKGDWVQPMSDERDVRPPSARPPGAQRRAAALRGLAASVRAALPRVGAHSRTRPEAAGGEAAAWREGAAASAAGSEARAVQAQVRALMGGLGTGLLPPALYDYDAAINRTDALLSDEALAHIAFGGLAAHLPRRARAAPAPASGGGGGGGGVAAGGAAACAVGDVPRGAAYELDLSWMCALSVRAGFERYGAVAFFGERQQALAIWWCHGATLVRPGEPLWAHAKWVWRSSVLTAVTLRDHLATVHLVLANGLVTASREQLGASHPLRRLLKPFTYRTVAVNRGARSLLCAELSLLHRAVALDADGLRAAFALSISSARANIDLLSHALLDTGAPPLDAGRGRTPFASDARLFRRVVVRMVRAYVRAYYASDGALLHDEQLLRFWHALRGTFARLPALAEGGDVAMGVWPLRRNRTRAPREVLVEALSSLLVAVTALHTHVGSAAEYVRDPRFAGSKIRPGVEVADVQASMQVLSIALVTGLKQPMLLDDYTHVLLRDGRLGATVRIFETFQADLRALSQRVQRMNRKRRFKPQSFDPARLSSSVSI